MTVPEAAKRLGRDPETVRRWIRSGKLRSQRVGTQHLIDERDLEPYEAADEVVLRPNAWKDTWTGQPPLNPVRMIRRSRSGR